MASMPTVSYYHAAYAREIAYSRYIGEVNGDNRAAYRRILKSISCSLTTYNVYFK